MRVMVTRKDIEFGKPGSHAHCPIARAIRRVVAADTVSVIGSSALVRRYGQPDRYYAFPAQATEFIDNFDGGEPVEPFVFETTKEYAI